MSRFNGDWYSPTRLHDSPTPGDRFIPNRSLMDLDQAHTLLTSRTREVCNSTFSFGWVLLVVSRRIYKCFTCFLSWQQEHIEKDDEYRRKLEENLFFDSEGRPFRMLVFRGSPKSSKKSIRFLDEMQQQDEAEALHNKNIKQFQYRHLPKDLTENDRFAGCFPLNVYLGFPKSSDLYLWNAETGHNQKLMQVDDQEDYPTSIAWCEDGRRVAVGHLSSKLQLWDAETFKLIRSLEGHDDRVGITAWNGQILTSGSRDKSIINHDVRARNSLTCRVQIHSQEVCGLKWSITGNKLASGGNENLIYIWEASKMCSSNFLHRFSGHQAAVKALAWCPYQSDVLASGGGTLDGCIKIWNIQKGTCINSIGANAQICGLEWNRHHKEILSGHGFSATGASK
ncbi:Cell division cycle 20.5, cofactor of APC complex [Vitis vinifera]|uniref:Cell division cycle 20.5, cofactor of APC complex n=1 Tax=Vitis vinifera TaxID=29760 RepID=A0A438IND8_VITVI|nr:Cell division cycle 20.5, cofactor of APC complex [Vitis vinifera]